MNTDAEAVLDAWRISARTTSFLVESLPPELWSAALSSAPRRTVGSLCAHLHNSRCSWLKGLASGTGIKVPARLSPGAAAPLSVQTALGASSESILDLLRAGLENAGVFPGVSRPFVWGAWPRQAVLFLAYAVSHEAHHRGQILLVAREAGHRLPAKVAGGLWQWSSRLKEAKAMRPAATRAPGGPALMRG